MLEICGTARGPKCSCKRPKDHPGEHVDEHGVRWPYTSVEIIRKAELDGRR